MYRIMSQSFPQNKRYGIDVFQNYIKGEKQTEVFKMGIRRVTKGKKEVQESEFLVCSFVYELQNSFKEPS